jgi:membrane fusion protein, heavy metal efflux system
MNPLKSIQQTFLFPLLSLAVMVMLSMCGKESSDASSEAIDISANPHSDEIRVTKEQFETSAMVLGGFEQKKFSNAVKANGYIDVPPEYKASVSVKLSGFVKGLRILPGEKVQQGAVLFTLENPEFIQLQQDYLETKAQLTYLQADYERQKSLADENITSQKNFLKAESDFKVAQARLAGLTQKLKLLNVKLAILEQGKIEPVVNVLSPISGYIAKVNITRGQAISAADIAVEVVSTEHMHVELQVFEKDVPYIQKGQRIVFNVSGAPQVKYEGTVYLIGKTIDGDMRSVNIHGHIEDEHTLQSILPGMYVEAVIEVESKQKTAVPLETVVEMENEYYILVHTSQTAGDYTFESRKVTVGNVSGNWIEIMNAADFKTDDIMLVKGAFNLLGTGGGHDH